MSLCQVANDGLARQQGVCNAASKEMQLKPKQDWSLSNYSGIPPHLTPISLDPSSTSSPSPLLFRSFVYHSCTNYDSFWDSESKRKVRLSARLAGEGLPPKTRNGHQNVCDALRAFLEFSQRQNSQNGRC